RRLLELKDADAVCVATPDHWHARMAIDAMQAGKDVYCEKPMTRTIEEAQALVDAWDKTGRVMTVGVQSMADPGWAAANELIRRGRIGHVAQAQTGVYRNDIRGQWRFYPLRREMTPQTIDWDMWLGHAFAVAGRPVGPDAAFDRALFAQWRCYGDFGGGIFTDLLAAPVTRLLAALGVRYPARVTGSGGLYLEHDGRDVPDVASLLAEFGEGFQLVATASTVTAYPVEEVIRGRFGALKFVRGGVQVIRDDPCRGSGIPARLEESLPAAETVPVTPPRNETRALWEDFLARVRSRDRNTLCPPDLAAAALATVAMGALGCRTGKVLAWDRARRAAVEAGENPAGRREGNARPPDAGPPRPPEYMRLAGPWVNGNDPARA
ncbi:MAG TPA: Gfo/Idh/MocA family oxidoreductase, partial [Gemmataceae bacterium]